LLPEPVIDLVQRCARSISIDIEELLEESRPVFPRLRAEAVKRDSDIDELGSR
jgi:hypothetical protein